MQLLGAKIVKTLGRYAFHGSLDSVALREVKRSKMKKSAIKDLCYGGMLELLNNRNYYYHSTVGAGYSHLTEEGKEAVIEFMNMIAYKMKEAEDHDLNDRAKQQVLDQLKKKD
jgi:hypothetical protein